MDQSWHALTGRQGIRGLAELESKRTEKRRLGVLRRKVIHNSTIQLEIWNIYGAQDYDCLKWDGTIWEKGTGPIPGTATQMNDTHKHCHCKREPIDIDTFLLYPPDNI